MFEKIENILSEQGHIKIKIYSLEYIIEFQNNVYKIYAELYPNKYYDYNSLKDLFDYFTIYNENLISNISRIIIL